MQSKGGASPGGRFESISRPQGKAIRFTGWLDLLLHSRERFHFFQPYCRTSHLASPPVECDPGTT
jgi:hypothetical protein